MGNAPIKGFPYTQGTENIVLTRPNKWIITNAEPVNAQKKPGLLFRFNTVNANGQPIEKMTLDHMKNGFRRHKMLKYPYVLSILESAETDQAILLVTEEARPLSQWLAENRDLSAKEFQSYVVWGLYSLVSTIKFFGSSGLVHGNLSTDSVWVTPGGDWKVACFQDMYESDDNSEDLFSLGKVIWEVFYRRIDSDSDIRNAVAQISSKETPEIPESLQNIVSKLLSKSKKLSPADILSVPFFRSPLVGALIFLDELAVKDVSEKNKYFSALQSMIGTWPRNILNYRLLPTLMVSLEYGSASGSSALVLTLILEIASSLPTASFQKSVLPFLTTQFSSPDRATRLQLLHHLPSYAKLIPKNVINEQILTSIKECITDSTPIMREASLKALDAIAPMLTIASLTSGALVMLQRCTEDPEPAVRVNGLICLGRVSEYLVSSHAHAQSQARDTLLSVCGRSLRDPFGPARSASLRSLQFALALESGRYFAANACASKLLPACAGVVLDPVADVRAQAQLLVAAIMKRLLLEEDRLVQEEEKAKAEKARLENERKEREAIHIGTFQPSASSNGAGTSGSGSKTKTTPLPPQPPSAVKNPIPSSSSSTSVSSLNPDLNKPLDDEDFDGWDTIPTAKSVPKSSAMKLGATKLNSASNSLSSTLSAVPSLTTVEKKNDGWGEDDDLFDDLDNIPTAPATKPLVNPSSSDLATKLSNVNMDTSTTLKATSSSLFSTPVDSAAPNPPRKAMSLRGNAVRVEKKVLKDDEWEDF